MGSSSCPTVPAPHTHTVKESPQLCDETLKTPGESHSGKLQHSPTPPPPSSSGLRLSAHPVPRSQELSQSQGPDPGTPVSQPPSRGRQLLRPLSSMFPAEQPRLLALRPPTTQENAGSPGPSLWPPPRAGSQLGLGSKSTHQALWLWDTKYQHRLVLGSGLHLQALEQLGQQPPRPSPLPSPAHRLCLLGEPLGEPLDGEPLGDPFPWVPLFSPLNMVVKAGAGSGWARRAAGGRQRGASLLVAWLGSGEVGLPDQEGKQFLGGPSLQVRPWLLRMHTHSPTLTPAPAQPVWEERAQPRRQGARACPTARGGLDLLHPQAQRVPAGITPRWGNSQAQEDKATDRQTDTGMRRLRDRPSLRAQAPVNKHLQPAQTRCSQACPHPWLSYPTPGEEGPLPASPGWVGGPWLSAHHQGIRVCSVFSSNMVGKPGTFTLEDWHKVHF